MIRRFAFSTAVVAAFICSLEFSSISLAQSDSPFEFAQRRDVGRAINIQPSQRELIQRLAPVCNAQCQAQVADMLLDATPELQSQFMQQSDSQRAATAAGLMNRQREIIETDMLSENVLDDQQMNRFLQMRTQSMGNNSFLDDRVSGMLQLSPDQVTQLRAIQDAGTGLLDACQSIPGLTQSEQQQGVQLIQNNLIDQSINILNGAQIQIFIELCGEKCEFDPCNPEAPEDPTNPDDDTDEDLPNSEADTEASPNDTEPNGDDVSPDNGGGSGIRDGAGAPQPTRLGASPGPATVQPRPSTNTRTENPSPTPAQSGGASEQGSNKK